MKILFLDIDGVLNRYAFLWESHGMGIKTFSTGSVRSDDADGYRYDLISPIGLARVAKTYHEGAVKYGAKNWLAGQPIEEMLNHALKHIFTYLGGDRSEDHLAHAAWNLLGAIHSEEAWPHLNTELCGPGCTPPASGTDSVQIRPQPLS